jgi:DNA-binding NarL/FixJ family response regulator
MHHLLIADDHPLFRGALREAVSGLLGGTAVGEAGTFEEVARMWH